MVLVRTEVRPIDRVRPEPRLAVANADGERWRAGRVDPSCLAPNIPGASDVTLRDVVGTGATIVAGVSGTAQPYQDPCHEQADDHADSERAPPPHAGTFGVLAAWLDVRNSRSISVW
jgi:hypothetical protein